MGCRRVADPADLVRVVRTGDGSLLIGRHPGRGAWVCPNVACVDRAASRGAFARALRGAVSPQAVVSLRAAVDERARMDNRHTGETGSRPVVGDETATGRSVR